MIFKLLGNPFFMLAFLSFEVVFCLAVRYALYRVDQDNRKIHPELVWLYLIPIPIFALGWLLFMVVNTARSLTAEFAGRGLSFSKLWLYGAAALLMGMWLAVAAVGVYYSFSGVKHSLAEGGLYYFFIWSVLISMLAQVIFGIGAYHYGKVLSKAGN